MKKLYWVCTTKEEWKLVAAEKISEASFKARHNENILKTFERKTGIRIVKKDRLDQLGGF